MGQCRGQVLRLQRGHVGCAKLCVKADIDQLHHPGVRRAGIDEQARLVCAECDRDIRADGWPIHGSCVGIDPARQVDRDDHAAGARRLLGEPGLRFTQPATAADAEHPVDDQVGRENEICHSLIRGGQQPPSGLPHGGSGALVNT